LAYKGYNQEKHSLAAYLFKVNHLLNYLEKHNNKPGLYYKRDFKQAFRVQNCFKARL
jgi:hypothetical protein